ncbi:hypothetical protein C0992_009815 [Termitomyces sp. T32_za158]|nr:hypothetical protein C0992_009815 [Termitomyces sp. T32_za158]
MGGEHRCPVCDATFTTAAPQTQATDRTGVEFNRHSNWAHLEDDFVCAMHSSSRSALAVHNGYFECKKRFNRVYHKFYFVLTAAAFFHEKAFNNSATLDGIITALLPHTRNIDEACEATTAIRRGIVPSRKS